jgi:hypothetical protein
LVKRAIIRVTITQNKMKSIFSESKGYDRVEDNIAEKKVKTGLYKYVSKTEYKNATKVEISTTVVDPEKKNNKLERRLKLKQKQQ